MPVPYFRQRHVADVKSPSDWRLAVYQRVRRIFQAAFRVALTAVRRTVYDGRAMKTTTQIALKPAFRLLMPLMFLVGVGWLSGRVVVDTEHEGLKV